MPKKNLQFKKTVDEISNIIKEEAKKKNIEKQKKNFYKTNPKKQKILYLGVVFFTIMVFIFWFISFYPFFQKNNFKDTSSFINNTKKDIGDIINTFSNSENEETKNTLETEKINIENKINTSTPENKIIEKILLKIKENTSTEEIKK